MNPKKSSTDYISAPFEADIKFIFEGFEVETRNCKGFTNSVRSLLVDNILKNMNFNDSNENETNDEQPFKDTLRNAIQAMAFGQTANPMTLAAKRLMEKNGASIKKDLITFSGLPYMLEKKYFDEAFILHDESVGTKQLNEIMLHMMLDDSFNNTENAEMLDYLNKHQTKKKKGLDMRAKLDQKWASLKNIFRYQPLWTVRDYFGEQVALYFSYSGAMLSSLWFPVLVGIAFFIIGVLDR